MLSDHSTDQPSQKENHGEAWSALSSLRTFHARLHLSTGKMICIITLLCIYLLTNALSPFPVAAAATRPTVHLPIAQANYTLKQFLQQGKSYKPTDAPLVRGNGKPTLAPSSKIANTPKKDLPSAEPPQMKGVSTHISSQALSTSSYVGSQKIVAAPLHIVGNDTQGTRLEVIIPAKALDLTTAKTSTGKTPQLPLTIGVTQQSGHFIGMTTTLGTFLIQITDAQGQTVTGLTLHSPATFILHYRSNELQSLDLEPTQLLMTWPALAISTNAATAKAAVIPMTNNAKAGTLTAQSTLLVSAAATLGVSDPMNQAPQKPHMAATGGNTGQLNYSYPLTVAPGPPGTVPQLAANYSSAATNSRHAPTAPADNMGEGWSLSMPSITTEVEGGGSIWHSISGLDGVSDRLIPDNSSQGAGTNYVTEHLSYLKIKKVDAGFDGQNCFHVWDTEGNYYEFGCSRESLQYYTDSSNNRTNYRYDVNKFVPANDGNTSRVVNYHYVQVTNSDSGYTSIRDAALVQIVYGTSSTPAGTIDLFYKGPLTQSVNGTQYVTAYGNNEGGCVPPDGNTTTKRCDDPEDKSGGLPNAWVMSVLSLSTIKTYVGNDSATSHLNYSYAFSYSDSPYSNCTDPQSGSKEYCAGNHLLTSITPTVYQNGTGHALPSLTLGYSDNSTRLNKYEDSSQSVAAGGHFKLQTNWRFLTTYHDHSNGVGANILYHTAYNNSNGTPASSDGDNRYDPLYCVWHPGDCTSSSSFYPYYNKMWTEQVVYQITQIGTDSSAASLAPGTTTYHYNLSQTTGPCAPDSNGMNDCVGFGWIPDSTDGWQDYYHGDFRGFGEVDITSPSGDLTVQKYYATNGWDSPESNPVNYLAGNPYEEDSYAGGTADSAHLLKQIVTSYAGNNGTAKTCSSAYSSGLYKPCEVIPLTSKTTTYEQTGNPGPWVQTSTTWDDYSTSSGLISGAYHNKTSEVVTSSNAPTKTQNWTYQTTDTTVNGTVYYNVHAPIHTETVDASGHTWACSDTTYDEKRTSGLPSPSAGWPTTVKTYSTCGNSGSAITTYVGYDLNGNAVATVDGLATSNSVITGLYSGGSAGCTLTLAPVYISSNWTASRYTSCTAYNSTNAVPTDTWDALKQHTQMVYDSTQGLLPTSLIDVNSQTTGLSYSYDSSGNMTTQQKLPNEANSYTKQGTHKSTCTDSSTLPCVEVDGNTSLYSSAVTRTFYDTLGRKVETLVPGPDATHTTVSFTVYNDVNRSTFASQPLVVAARTTWLDPNDPSVASLAGTSTYMDAAGRTIATLDAIFASGGNSGTACPSLATYTAQWSTPLTRATTCTSYSLGTVNGDSNTYAMTTTIDANGHVLASYADELSGEKTPRIPYVVTYGGTYGGTLTATTQTATHYNILNKPTSITVTDLAPQAGQTVTSVTTTTQYDALGRQTSLNDPDRGTHTYSYDADGKQLTDVSGTRIIGVSYDLLGRAICIQDAAPTTDGSGNCSSGSHPLVQSTYDTTTLGTLGTNDFPVGQMTKSVATTYYPDGTSAITTEQFQHNQRGLVTTQTLQFSLPGSWNVTTALPTYQETQAYNDASQSTTTQTTVGGQAGYIFTQAYNSTTGLLTGLSNNSIGVANLATLAFNNQAQVSDINFQTTTGSALANLNFSYDGDLRLAGSAATWQSGSGSNGTIFSQGVAYDAMGNVISKVNTHGSVSGQTGSGGTASENFCYDEQNRLTWAGNSGTQPGAGNGICGNATLNNALGGNSYNTSYAYTNLGQIWQEPLNGVGTEQQALYCDNTHPHQLTGLYPPGTTCTNLSNASYSTGYDAWGNLTSRTYNGSTATLSYDVLDHLTQWNAGSNSQDWYVYDASGQRVLQRSTTSNTSLTVYAFGLEEHVYDGSGNHQSDTYYYTLNKRLIGALTGGNTQFYLTDTLGSVLSTFNDVAGSAIILGNQVYTPYGTKGYNSGSMGTSKGYTGQYEDPTGLDYYNARYYDPIIGQFVSADTVDSNAKGMDPYAYVIGNPETKSDPTGHSWWDEVVGWLSNLVDPVSSSIQQFKNTQTRALKSFLNGQTDTIDPADLQNLDVQQIRLAIPANAKVRVMNNGLTGIVYQWRRADGTIMQVETYGPTNSGRGLKTDGQSTLHISMLKTDANGNVATDPQTGYPTRTWELNGDGSWISSDLANPRSVNAQESLVQGVHIQMETVTPDSVSAMESIALGTGTWTEEEGDFGVSEDLFLPSISGFQEALDQPIE